MESQLNQLAISQHSRPIILNGKLLMHNGHMLGVRQSRYSPQFEEIIKNGKAQKIANGYNLLIDAANDFNNKYSTIFNNISQSSLSTFHMNFDKNSGAIVMNNDLFLELMDKDGKNGFHDGSRLLACANLIRQFNVELIVDYLKIFNTLLNRRLYMTQSSIVKGTLVAGLFQPLAVYTNFIAAPITMMEYSWLFDALGDNVKQVTQINDSTNGLFVTAIAMCDFMDKFNTPLMRDMNRFYFLFILYLSLIGVMDKINTQIIISKFPSLWNSIRNDEKLLRFTTSTMIGLDSVYQDYLRTKGGN